MPRDGMGNFVTIGVLAAGGYLLYRYFMEGNGIGQDIIPATGVPNYSGGPVTTGVPTTQGPQAGSGVQSSQPGTNVEATLAGIRNQVASRAGRGTLNFWQWNYILEQGVKAIPTGQLDPYQLDPAIQDVPVSTLEQTGYTLDEWWSFVSPVLRQHLSGGMAGLGGNGGIVTTGQVAAQASGYYGIPGLAGNGRARTLVSYGPGSQGMRGLERARAIETMIRPVN